MPQLALRIGRVALASICAVAAQGTALAGTPTTAAAPEAVPPAAEATAAQGELVVTARKRPERAVDVPVALSIVTGDLLESRRLYQIEDLKQLSPGLNISYFNPRGNYVSIRGIGRNPASDGLEPAVGIFVDGVYLGRPGMAVYDLADIDTVQILRGPQSTLFGKNTTAGAIVITTRAPDFRSEGEAEATIGSNGYVQLRGSASGALIDQRLAVRLSLYHTGQAGWVARLGGGPKLNGSDRTGGRLQFLLEPSATIKLRLSADYHEESDSCCTLVAGSFGPASATYLARVAAAGGAAVLGGRDYLTTADAPTFLKVQQGGAAANLVADLGAAELTSITAYRKWHYRAGFDGDLSSADAYVSAAVPTDDWQFSEELRLANHSGSSVDWTAGAYYLRQSLESALRLAFGGQAASFLGNTSSPPAGLRVFNNTVSSTGFNLNGETLAAFGQLTWHIDPRLAFTVGARGTYERKWGIIDRPSNPAQPAYRQALSISEVDPAGTIALAYAANADLHFYGSFSRGSKAGGINPIVATSTDDQIVHPEHTDSFELGLKSALLGGRAHLDLGLFYTRISDYQATLNRLFRAILTNVGQVSTRGVELQADWQPSRGLGFAFNGSFSDAHYDRYPNAPCPPERTAAPSCDLSGQALADAPRWIINASARYRHRLGTIGDISLAADYSYKSAYFGNIDNSSYSRLGDVGIVNAQLGLDLKRSGTSLLLWVKNLGDARYLQSYPLGGGTIYGAYFGTIGLPRAFGLTVSNRFF
ncbi:TonB-dependent receptor [Novosphingobium sp.]|uniref:TonB-dependent receptor n=1 Tax=Novosphingobium sp. TaxID=1874826 RepID=UPI003BA9A879